MTDHNVFSEEYDVVTSSSEADDSKQAVKQLEKQLQKQVKSYGTGKPRRITVRAKITND